MRYPRIVGTGSYVPEKVVTNFEYEQLMDTSDEWIQQRTGIKQRHVIEREGIGSSDLALEAARRALDAAGMQPEELNLIVFATMTPDRVLPSSACFLQSKLGASNAAAFDVMAACSGFIYALSVAEQFIKSGQYENALVVGAEIFSNRMDFTNRNTAVLFGDGAGAAIVRATDKEGGILSSHLHADGSRYDLLWVPAPGSAAPPYLYDNIESGDIYLHMKGRDLFRAAVQLFREVSMEALNQNGYELSDIDLFIPHQANGRMIEVVADMMGVPREKVVLNIAEYGNTTAASIPIAIDEARRGGRIKEDSLVLLAAFGGGLTWASALIRW